MLLPTRFESVIQLNNYIGRFLMRSDPKSSQRVSVLLAQPALNSISAAAALDALPTRVFGLMTVRKALERRHPEKQLALRKAWTDAITDDKLTFLFERVELELLDKWAKAEGKRSRAELIREILTT